MTTPAPDHISWLEAAAPEEMRRTIEALHKVHHLVAALTDLDTLLARIIEESRRVARAEASSIILYDEKKDDLYFQVAVGDSGDQAALLKEIRLKMGQGIAGATAATRTPINVPNAQEDSRFFREADAASQFKTRNLLAVPMIDRDKLVGVLEVLNKIDGDAFTEVDVHVMEIFSSVAATTITNARLIEEQLRNARLAAIGEAVSGLSHHTKNIVTGLSSSAELIDLGLERKNIDVLERSWPVFKRSVRRISNFVQDMLSFSKARVPLREACAVDEIINDAYETFSELFGLRQVEVSIDTSTVTFPIYVDGQSIYRCVLNLITNAADAIEQREGRVRIAARPAGDGALEITVADNGPGVPLDLRERIFDPFFSTKGSRGTGLGLATTAKIIQEHGGAITVGESDLGGACFIISLPVGNEEKGPDFS
ncbi:MAG: GAF domain-containing protein [Candidatus Hydrogenedentes bacterium]|nr:GAF domain-containing protein [Candidatus Hydrogenedentota bacterium]